MLSEENSLLLSGSYNVDLCQKLPIGPIEIKVGTTGLHHYRVSHNVCMGLVSIYIQNAHRVIIIMDALTADILKAKLQVSE